MTEPRIKTKHKKETMLLNLAVDHVPGLSDRELEHLRIKKYKPRRIKTGFFFKFNIDLSVHDNPNEAEFRRKLKKFIQIAVPNEINHRKAIATQKEIDAMELRLNEQENENLRLEVISNISDNEEKCWKHTCHTFTTMGTNMSDSFTNMSDKLISADVDRRDTARDTIKQLASPMQRPALPFSSPIQNGTDGARPGATSSASSTRGSSGVASGLMGNGRGLSSATSHSAPTFSPPEKIESRKGDHNMDISPSNKTNGGFAALDPQLSVMDSESAKKRSSGVGGSPNNKDGPFLLPEQMQQSYWSKHKSGLPDFTQRSRTNQSLRPDHEKHSFGGSGTSGVASGLTGNGCGLSGATPRSAGDAFFFSPNEKIESRKDDTNMVISPSNNIGPFRLPYHTEQMHQQYRSQKYASKHDQFGFINGVPDFKQQRHRNQSLSPDHGHFASAESDSDEEAKPPKSKKPNLRSTPPSMRNLRKTPPSMR